MKSQKMFLEVVDDVEVLCRHSLASQRETMLRFGEFQEQVPRLGDLLMRSLASDSFGWRSPLAACGDEIESEVQEVAFRITLDQLQTSSGSEISRLVGNFVRVAGLDGWLRLRPSLTKLLSEVDSVPLDYAAIYDLAKRARCDWAPLELFPDPVFQAAIGACRLFGLRSTDSDSDGISERQSEAITESHLTKEDILQSLRTLERLGQEEMERNALHSEWIESADSVEELVERLDSPPERETWCRIEAQQNFAKWLQPWLGDPDIACAMINAAKWSYKSFSVLKDLMIQCPLFSLSDMPHLVGVKRRCPINGTPEDLQNYCCVAGITESELVDLLRQLDLVDDQRYRVLSKVFSRKLAVDRRVIPRVFEILQFANVAAIGDKIYAGYEVNRAVLGLNTMRWLSGNRFKPTMYFDRWESRSHNQKSMADGYDETSTIAFVQGGRLYRACQAYGYRSIGELLINLGTHSLRDAGDQSVFATWSQGDEHECKGSYIGYMFGDEHKLRRLTSELAFERFFEIHWPDSSLWSVYEPGALTEWITSDQERARDFEAKTGYGSLLHNDLDSHDDGVVVWYD